MLRIAICDDERIVASQMEEMILEACGQKSLR